MADADPRAHKHCWMCKTTVLFTWNAHCKSHNCPWCRECYQAKHGQTS